MQSQWLQSSAKTLFAISFLLLCIDVERGAAQQTEPVTRESSTTNEDWRSISLATSNLKAEPPLLGETDDYPAFTREMIEVQWRPGDPIYLYVIRPKGVQRAPVILYLYGFPSDTDRFLNEDFCKLLVKDGFAAIGFALALTGQRYHDRPMKEWFVSELQESLASSAHDVQMVLNYLSTRSDMDMSRIGMFGEGSGAAIAIIAASADPRIKAIDLLDPWGDWPDWLAKSSLVPEEERGDYVKPEFLKKVASLEPIECLRRLKIPIRLQHMNQVSVTPEVARERIEAVAPPQTQIVPEEEAVAAYRASSGTKFLDWIKNSIRTPLGQESSAARIQ